MHISQVYTLLNPREAVFCSESESQNEGILAFATRKTAAAAELSVKGELQTMKERETERERERGGEGS